MNIQSVDEYSVIISICKKILLLNYKIVDRPSNYIGQGAILSIFYVSITYPNSIAGNINKRY
jgi:hypothetical protein